MEFLTLHQLSRELNKPEKVLRYKFLRLCGENKLVEGEDYIREGFKDTKHFIYKINPLRFIQLTDLKPTPLPDTNGYQTGNNLDNNGYQSDNQVDTKPLPTDTNFGNQEKNNGSSDAQGSERDDEIAELMEFFIGEINEKNRQLERMDEQLKNSQKMASNNQETTSMALTEIIKLNHTVRLLASKQSTSSSDTNGYQNRNPVEINVDNQEEEFDNKDSETGNQSDTNREQDRKN